jgi:hypothetical protein
VTTWPTNPARRAAIAHARAEQARLREIDGVIGTTHTVRDVIALHNAAYRRNVESGRIANPPVKESE